MVFNTEIRVGNIHCVPGVAMLFTKNGVGSSIFSLNASLFIFYLHKKMLESNISLAFKVAKVIRMLLLYESHIKTIL